MKKTLYFVATIGATKGYDSQSTLTAEEASRIVAIECQNVANEVEEKTGLYIGTVVSPANVTYKIEWGCPIGGEAVAIVTGSQNSEFHKDQEEWKKAVVELIDTVRKNLQQQTVFLEFRENLETYYLKD